MPGAFDHHGRTGRIDVVRIEVVVMRTGVVGGMSVAVTRIVAVVVRALVQGCIELFKRGQPAGQCQGLAQPGIDFAGTVRASDNPAFAPGDKVVLSGSAQMFGISPGTAGSIFRFGLFNVNGSANTNGWLGYFVQSASSGGTGSLQERALVNITSFTSTSGGGSASIQTLPVATSALTSAVYNFSFTLERNALNGLIITTSLVRTSDSLEFAGASFTDTTVNAGAFTFDRVGFQGTTDLNADRIQMNNVDVTFTSVPEPSAALLGGLGVLALLRRRL
jgi:hypothetical protein